MTRLGCGGVFVYDFVTNFLLSLTVKEWKSANIWWSYGQELGVLFFWLTVYIERGAYGPADATASQTPCLVEIQTGFTILEKRPLNRCSSSSSLVFTIWTVQKRFYDWPSLSLHQVVHSLSCSAIMCVMTTECCFMNMHIFVIVKFIWIVEFWKINLFNLQTELECVSHLL